MPDAAQFTLNLFDSSALGWTVPVPMSTSADDNDASDETEAPIQAPVARAIGKKLPANNYRLTGDRTLARGWPARGRENVEAIRLSKQIEDENRAATPAEQAKLMRYVAFGASELAQSAFMAPGEHRFRSGWEQIGDDLRETVTPIEYAALQRVTQYAHYTSEQIVRAVWRAAQRLGFAGGRVLEPGIGTGLFFAAMPDELRDVTRLTGVEYDPVTARIARLLHPKATIRAEDYTRSSLGDGFDLVIGNPPFAARTVRADPRTASLGLQLHDYFIARSISRLRPGGLALFVTSTGTMDKTSTTAREHIAGMADLVGAVRLPEYSMQATAGTHVVVDILVFQRRAEGHAPAGPAWHQLVEVTVADEESAEASDPEAADPSATSEAETDPPAPDAPSLPRHLRRGVVLVNEYFTAHPEMVLGTHAQRRGIYGIGRSYTCLPNPDAAGTLEVQIDAALWRLPENIHTPDPDALTNEEPESPEPAISIGRAADGATVKEGSYLNGPGGRLCQVANGGVVPVEIKDGKTKTGIAPKAVKVIRALMAVRDALRDVLRAQADGRPYQEQQVRLRCAYSNFIRYYGPINHTTIVVQTDAETGEERVQHRRPNLAHFADDPDCWLVASIEYYDVDTGLARRGPIFSERVISPPAAPIVTTAADALAVTLNATGRVDPDHIAELLECSAAEAMERLGQTVFLNPATEVWEIEDAYLSGPVRHKLAAAEIAVTSDGRFARNVEALRLVQPQDLLPSDITARLGAPWLPDDVIEAFVSKVMDGEVSIRHSEAFATWTVVAANFARSAAGTSEWGTERRNATGLLHDALNGSTPQIFDVIIVDGSERRVLNLEETEAAKEKLNKIKTAFVDWVWTDSGRADRLSRLYNDRFNNLVPRRFDGSHLTLPGASAVIRFYPHQKNATWRVISAGSTYIAHAVGAGKTFTMIASIMEQRRLGLIGKALIAVPGHCLAQFSREFLQLYPNARILVADESNFAKEKRARFLARAATDLWDAIIITHAAFKFIAIPGDFERAMINDEMQKLEEVALDIDSDDRITRKRVEALKERLAEKLETLQARRDDMLTIAEMGIDQLIVDESQEFRKRSFATNRTTLKGVDPDGSQRAWDLYVRRAFIATVNPRRALIQASGTPITNTMGELFTLLRFQNEGLLIERGVHEFDAWAACFGETRTELELQPSGAYKPVERFSQFVNIPELIDMFRTVADVVQKDDLRPYVRLPPIKGGQRQLITAPASEGFRGYQAVLADRIEKIRTRTGKVQKGDDILLSVITDGRHAAIDMRLASLRATNDEENKLNRLIRNVLRIWQETAADRFNQPDGTPFPIPGAAQMIFSDLGTLAAEDKRGFSAYAWIKAELIRLGVPAAEIAIMQHFKRSAEKQRLFNDVNAGRVRIILGSTQTMGTGVNAQLRLRAMHHLDVPWLPSDIEQREGRIERQGNQSGDIEIVAYATLGSMDATMWQNNERKQRFILAALAGDRSVRKLEDVGDAADQFALAKAIASGDARLMQKAGLESEIARLERQRAAHFNDQLAVRRRITELQDESHHAARRADQVSLDLAQHISTRGDAFVLIAGDRRITERRVAGAMLLSKVRLMARSNTEDEIVLGTLGGFDLVGWAGRTWRNQFEASLLLRRHGIDEPIQLEADLTQAGLIARIEHILEHFEDQKLDYERKTREAEQRLVGFRERLGQPFALQGELDGKLAQLSTLNADLKGETNKTNEMELMPEAA